MAFGMPFALLGLHRYLMSGKRIGLAWFALGWLSALLSNAYCSCSFPILVRALAVVGFSAPRHGGDTPASERSQFWRTAAVLPLLRGYYVRQTAYGFVRSYNEIKAMSADITALAGISHRTVLWKGWLPEHLLRELVVSRLCDRGARC
jgi:hypothetical protein